MDRSNTIEIELRPMLGNDWPEVARIYKEGIDTGNATFQKEAPAVEDWDKAHVEKCRIVAVSNNVVVGWAALTMVSGRSVYAGVAEVSVYVANNARGQKVGSRLMGKLITESEEAGFWTLQAGIFPENTPSMELHQHFGFRQVGFRNVLVKWMINGEIPSY